MKDDQKLIQAKQGDINAFNDLFMPFSEQLKSYLYRLLTNREDVEDFYHNTFIKGFEKIKSFNGGSGQLKSWIFTIATNLSFNHLKKQNRWSVNAQDNCRNSLVNDPAAQKEFINKVMQSSYNTYEINEHIDFCFTCINKTLTIEQQIALILKDIYQFKVREIGVIMTRSVGQVKHYLVDSRKIMADVFDNRCALINKQGTCHQCTELQGLFNPKVNIQNALSNVKLKSGQADKNKKELLKLRQSIVNGINPIKNNGAELHDHLMQHLKKVNELN